MTVHPEETALPFTIRSGSYYDKLESHLFKPLHTAECVWDGQSVVKSTGIVILLHLALEGVQSQCRVDEAPGEWLYRSFLG
jgi:hypothetical protein